MAADRIRLTEVAPPYCSSCFTQKPRMRHIDFGAVYDGPVIRSEEGLTLHQIDDLIICQSCLEVAGRLIGLGHIEKVQAELQNAIAENDELMERCRGYQAYIEAQESANKLRDQLPNGHGKTAKRKAAA